MVAGGASPRPPFLFLPRRRAHLLQAPPDEEEVLGIKEFEKLDAQLEGAGGDSPDPAAPPAASSSSGGQQAASTA